MKTLTPCKTIQANILFGFEVCFHHPKPLKTTRMQSNPIKEGYKTHTCCGLVATWENK
jgi:hypothetical protein